MSLTVSLCSSKTYPSTRSKSCKTITSTRSNSSASCTQIILPKHHHRKLYETITSSTRASRKRQYGTHYTIRLTPRKPGPLSCSVCECPKCVTFAKTCQYKVYDVVTGEIFEEGVEDVDFVGGKVVGFLYDDDITVIGDWEDFEEDGQKGWLGDKQGTRDGSADKAGAVKT